MISWSIAFVDIGLNLWLLHWCWIWYIDKRWWCERRCCRLFFLDVTCCIVLVPICRSGSRDCREVIIAIIYEGMICTTWSVITIMFKLPCIARLCKKWSASAMIMHENTVNTLCGAWGHICNVWWLWIMCVISYFPSCEDTSDCDWPKMWLLSKKLSSSVYWRVKQNLTVLYYSF